MNQIIQGDCIEELKKLPNESINMVMTSPPYWALRDYGIDNQLGLESTFEEYINKLCNIFDEVKRVLRDDGTCWINIGDTYFGGGGSSGHTEETKNLGYTTSKMGAVAHNWQRPSREEYAKGTIKKSCLICNKIFYGKENSQFCSRKCLNKKGNEFRSQNRLLPNKTLVMIPFRFAIEMVNRGWILRNTIIWHKRNCMPSSVKDRFTVDFDYLFFFSKKKKYYFETQREERLYDYDKTIKYDQKKNPTYGGSKITKEDRDKIRNRGIREGFKYDKKYNNSLGRNKRTVWSINPTHFSDYYCSNCGHFAKAKSKQEKEGYFGGKNESERVCENCGKELITSHFAIYPEELCETPIKSGCPKFVCVKCGSPKEAIFEPTEEYKKLLRNQGKGWSSERRKEAMKIGNALTEGTRHDITADYKKTGYKPTCKCNVDFTSGIVLDPFFGAGTTGLVALKQNKKFIGIELNKEYIKIANRRLKPFLEQTKLQ